MASNVQDLECFSLHKSTNTRAHSTDYCTLQYTWDIDKLSGEQVYTLMSFRASFDNQLLLKVIPTEIDRLWHERRFLARRNHHNRNNSSSTRYWTCIWACFEKDQASIWLAKSTMHFNTMSTQNITSDSNQWVVVFCAAAICLSCEKKQTAAEVACQVSVWISSSHQILLLT